MIEISDRMFAAYVGPNWESHYERAFDRIEDGSETSVVRSWNWAAAIVPYWFVYRGLLSWSIIFFLVFLVLYTVFATGFMLFSWMRYELYWVPIVPAYVATCIIQGVAADRLFYRLALRTINSVRRKALNPPSALRQLAEMAPKSPPGVYITHTILMVVGIPIWAVAVWIGTTALTPHYSEPQSVYVALMRTALRDLVVMQENFFFEAAQYSGDVELLRYFPPEGVVINLTSASDSGWSASASHAMVAQPCTIFIGRAAATDGAVEGIPACP